MVVIVRLTLHTFSLQFINICTQLIQLYHIQSRKKINHYENTYYVDACFAIRLKSPERLQKLKLYLI